MRIKYYYITNFKILFILFFISNIIFSCKNKKVEKKTLPNVITVSKNKDDLKFNSKTDSNLLVIEKKWETKKVFQTPESTLYDSIRQLIYVSNIAGNPTERDAEGFISQISTNGDIVNLKWIEGLDAPKGMAIYDEKLYVANLDEIIEIDINNNRIINRFLCKNAQFLNDVVADSRGTIYVSDSQTDRIYRLKLGRTMVWMEGKPLKRPNGLFWEESDSLLYVGCKDKVLTISLKDNKIREWTTGTNATDGITKAGKNGAFYVSDWQGEVWQVSEDGYKKSIVDTRLEKLNTADIGFVPSQNLLLIPTFFGQTVVAYEIKEGKH